jgi:hypothetical protein
VADVTNSNDKGDGIVGLVLLWILFGAFLLLIISPVDLIPDVAFPAGFVDDIVYGVVDLLIGALIYTQTKRRKRVKHDAEERTEKDITPTAEELTEGKGVRGLSELTNGEPSGKPELK